MQGYPKDHWKIVFANDPVAFRAFEAILKESRVTELGGKTVRTVRSPNEIIERTMGIPRGYVLQTFRSANLFLVPLVKNNHQGFCLFETTEEAREFEGNLNGWGRQEPIYVVGRYGAMRSTWDLLERVARTNSTLLLQGDSGTGKEVAAKFVHCHSDRSNGQFVTINCGAIPESLIESEIFGHEKGSFTGANAMRQGVLEMADGGTLLLDEIGDLPLFQQAKLLRVMQGEEFRRVGGTKAVRVDVRFIAATNKNLGNSVRTGNFRLDLYYRINVITCTMPRLRERVHEIQELVSFILAQKTKRSVSLNPDALQMLMAHTWPGNVRELENVLERALILCDREEIGPEHIILESDPIARSSVSMESFGGRTLPEIEKEVLLATLEKLHGNRTHAAKALGITVRTVRNRLRKYREKGKPSSN